MQTQPHSALSELVGDTGQTESVPIPAKKILVFSTLGTGSNEERRIYELLSAYSPVVFPFDRSHKGRSWRALWRVLKESRPDLVVLEGTGIFGGAALMLGRILLGLPYVVSSGDAVGPWIGTRSRLLQPMFAVYERVLYRLASGFIGWTPYLAGRALTFGTPRAMTAPGWAPFRCSKDEARDARDAMRASLGIAPSTIVVGIAGSLIWSKKWSKNRGYCYGAELIQAAIRCQRPDVCWLIVGDGDGKPHLEQAAKSVKSGRVIFTGRVPQSELPAYLAAMDIGSLPQSVDGVGSFRYTTKVSEYLAFRLPFVTSQIPLAYDFPSQWLWRLPGTKPWGDAYVTALANLVEQISWEEIHQKRDEIPDQIDIFDRDRQIERATGFIGDILSASGRL